MKKEMNLCPRCSLRGWDNKTTFPATSRRDNETEICSECGTDEALFDFMMHTNASKGIGVNELVNKIREEKAWLKRCKK